MDNKKRPFSRDYVVNLTLTNAINSCDLSINKTTARIAEFDNDPVMSAEILKTLSDLHSLKRALSEMRNV